jgi:hypothetical protein
MNIHPIKPRLLSLICLFFLFSCSNKEEVYIPSEYTCLMINQGNYSQSNGSLTILTKQGQIENQVYEKVNTWKIGAIIESATFYKNITLLMCSSEDKVEFIDKNDFKILSSPVTGMGIPRYCAAYNEAAYVTCVNNWTNPDGKVCKIDLETKKLVKKIPTGGTPEDIKEVDGLLYVAIDNGLIIINPDTDEIIERIVINENVFAKYIVQDHDNNLWISFISETKTGVAAFNLQTRKFSEFYPLDKMALPGNIDITPDGKTLLYLYAPDIVGGANPDVRTAVYSFDLNSHTVSSSPLFKCVGMYGFNVNPANGDIYTANVSGFTTNSITFRYDAEGNLLNEGWLTGTGTCRFYFP